MQATYEISDHGFLKIPLFNLHCRGGLKSPNRTQKIEGYYYKPTAELNGKIVLSFGLAKEFENQYIEKPSTLRFDSYNSMRFYVSHLIEAMVFMGKQESKINPKNFEFRLKQDLMMIENAYTRRL